MQALVNFDKEAAAIELAKQYGSEESEAFDMNFLRLMRLRTRDVYAIHYVEKSKGFPPRTSKMTETSFDRFVKKLADPIQEL